MTPRTRTRTLDRVSHRSVLTDKTVTKETLFCYVRIDSNKNTANIRFPIVGYDVTVNCRDHPDWFNYIPYKKRSIDQSYDKPFSWYLTSSIGAEAAKASAQALFDQLPRPAGFDHDTLLRTEAMTDVVTPGYKKISAKGGIVNTPMYSEKLTFTIGTLDAPSYTDREPVTKALTGTTSSGISRNLRVYRDWHPSFPFGNGAVQSAITGVISSGHVPSGQNAINSAYGNINVADLSALVAAGEAKSTISHLTSVLSRFVSIVKALKTGKWHTLAPKTYRKLKNERRAGKAVAIWDLFEEAWMEARYAWRPLIMDANAALNLIQGKRPLTPRQTFRGHDEYSSSEDVQLAVLSDDVMYYIEGTVTHSWVLRAGVLCEARSDINFGQQLNAANLVDAAVDLIPFSFVFQWFVNIGGLLYHMRPSGSYKTLASWVTKKCQSDFIGTVTATAFDGTTESVSFTRTSARTIREPGATPTLFSIDLDLDLEKLIDLTAILRKFGSR